MIYHIISQERCYTHTKILLSNLTIHKIDYPFTPGHECAAVVEKTGPKETRLKPGDRVAVDPAVSCGRCD